MKQDMVDLSGRAGFPLSLEASSHTLIFGNGVTVEEKQERRGERLVAVLERVLESEEKACVVYTVFRGVALQKDSELWKAARLRYDLTVIPPGRMGREFPKTFGHVHIGTSCELYQVLYGRANALLERWERDTVKDVVLLEAGAGETFLVPSGFGHVTINPFNETLVLANVLPRNIGQDYAPYEKQHGASYYLVASELGKDFIDILPNPNVKTPPPFTKVRPRLSGELSIFKGKPLYEIVELSKRYPELVRFFVSPETIMTGATVQTFFRAIGV